MNVKRRIEELGFESTPLGELTLRRRTDPLLGGREIFEVKLGDEYLMSSVFTESERQLARLGLGPLGSDLDVVVGGLGLGYTAQAALENEQVRRLLVIDLFEAVIEWHRTGVVPIGDVLERDARCEMRQGDFFELAQSGFDAAAPGRRFDAVLLDIDHSPEHFLGPASRSFYTAEGLTAVSEQLKPGGVFAMWSDDPADESRTDRFLLLLRQVFGTAEVHGITFPNPYTNAVSANSVYIARRT